MRRDSVYEFPEGLPVPVDDGACDHLRGMEIPSVALPSTTGELVDVAKVSRRRRTVFFFYPRSGRPDEAPLPGWDDIPGARGCTPQSCAYRDRLDEFEELGTQVFGVSSQDTKYQQEFAARTRLRYPLLSDEDLALARASALPTFEVGGMTLIKRLALVVSAGRIEKVFYPVFPPDRNADQVLAYLRGADREGEAAIRRATIADIETLVELRVAMQRENADDHSNVDWPALGEACRRYFAETLPPDAFVVFVAETEGQIIATSGLSFVSRPPSGTSYLLSEAYVTNVYTVPAWRGRGVATALMNATIGYARDQGARLVYLHTSDAGRSVYEKLGFTEYPAYMERRL